MARPDRKERQVLQYRREILQSAERLFAQSGFFNTSMAQIARDAEFAVGTLYQFFKSKDEIYIALMEGKFEEYLALVTQELERAKGVVEKIEALITTELQHFEKHRDFFRIYSTEWGGPVCTFKGPQGERVMKYIETYLGLIVRLMQSGIRQGLFKRMDAYEMAYLFNGMMRSIIHQWILSPGKDSLVAKASIIREIFLTGVLKRSLGGGRV